MNLTCFQGKIVSGAVQGKSLPITHPPGNLVSRVWGSVIHPLPLSSGLEMSFPRALKCGHRSCIAAAGNEKSADSFITQFYIGLVTMHIKNDNLGSCGHSLCDGLLLCHRTQMSSVL